MSQNRSGSPRLNPSWGEVTVETSSNPVFNANGASYAPVEAVIGVLVIHSRTLTNTALPAAPISTRTANGIAHRSIRMALLELLSLDLVLQP